VVSSPPSIEEIGAIGPEIEFRQIKKIICISKERQSYFLLFKKNLAPNFVRKILLYMYIGTYVHTYINSFIHSYIHSYIHTQEKTF
jgi:hypothetical protein